MLTPELVKKMLDAIAAEDGKAALSCADRDRRGSSGGGPADTPAAAARRTPWRLLPIRRCPKPGDKKPEISGCSFGRADCAVQARRRRHRAG
jgi:hypothetical protein